MVHNPKNPYESKNTGEIPTTPVDSLTNNLFGGFTSPVDKHDNHIPFNNNEIDKMMYSRGLEILWERSYYCTCREETTHVPSINCPICMGSGIGYLPPKKMTVTLQEQKKGNVRNSYGVAESGTAKMTVEREKKLTFKDRITVPHAKIPQSMIFDVSRSRIEHGYFMVYDVDSIEYIIAGKREEAPVQLEEGKDYRFAKGQNRIYVDEKWEGYNVSMNIKTTLRYLVWELDKEHRYDRNPYNTDQIEDTYQLITIKREDAYVRPEAFEIGSKSKPQQEISSPRKPIEDDMLGRFGFGGAPSETTSNE